VNFSRNLAGYTQNVKKIRKLNSGKEMSVATKGEVI
jgi:hypothetical protein